ncbi:long-subunit fatty acid transport protein [Parabacteroides sp. PF5-5]|uniref:type IX secretion system outer membrane channel protein PorV n=1 Tax=unclassified Parabacteroides TaxID=2649774 RepID=UPI002476A9EF|nr:MULTISPECIES: type IX secretion system outer membrane channel protein PorV [unclassified Parabacteroides]MDH6306980.1 long-subunit fatty acid transport protein [Parabacteroides sp. PH5-39]MDH6317854.1 long-subunit fatty acid transport protein [Parabacteroides sp. PF5-13]MDH6321585.1 long-subunit fatty acid transport protein [Parabacteroides sp. PH5-13]MDH6325339.1 long-subunit fatty acid transport protein [Parabacteroides sp. PH5-8]MDH6329010.1 long-subunit fatty acid transport protein [Par
MTKLAKIHIFIVCMFVTSLTTLHAQINKQEDFSPIQTAVPSLSIAPDARGGAMGDNGVATSPDIASQYWNPAKYAFSYSQAGVGLSYTPWLRKLVNDVALAYLSGYYKIGSNDNQAIGASLRYFTLGEVPMTSNNDVVDYYMNPYEMALDVSYSRKLSDSYSMAVALRYIRSDMSDKSGEMSPDNAFAADVAGYLEKYVILGNSEALWTFGFNISNIGTKVSYDGGVTNKFIPTNLRLGTGLLYPLDDYNRLGFYFDINKYLVPTYPLNTATNAEEEAQYEKDVEDYNSMSFMTGIFKSFHDAPGGFKEELKEINFSLGAEYSYNEQFFVRGGYYYENPNKGNRQYFSVGAGFRMSVFQLDAAYLISTVPSNPLDQTLRFSLSFDMDGIKNLFR